MNATIELVNKTRQSLSFKKNQSLESRFDDLKIALIKNGIEESKIIDAGDKPAAGAVLSCIYLKDRVRINYRCGYSRYNYAPCIEVIY